MAEAAHIKWSASGFEAVMLCPGKRVLEAGKPNTSSKYSAEGTAAHQVLTWSLQNNLPAHTYVGSELERDGFTITVNDDMARYVQMVVDYVREIAGEDGEVYVDTHVNYSQFLGAPKDDAWGTLDVAVLRGTTLYVIDFKYGQGVQVRAERNPQMSLYALGMIASLQDFCDIEKVVLVIHQPRINSAADEWETTASDLVQWGTSTARSAVASSLNAEMHDRTRYDNRTTWESTFLRPGEKQCKFCRAKAECPALRADVAETVSGNVPCSPEEFDCVTDPVKLANGLFDDVAAWLAACLSKVDLIEDWCAAVRAEAHRRLTAGEPVPGFKLVQGKRGNRAWSDAAAAEEALRAMRVKHDQMYDYKVISPTSAEKLFKAEVIGKRQWPKLQSLITQKDGVPAVAPASDPRPALNVQPIADAFEVQADATPTHPRAADEASFEDIC